MATEIKNNFVWFSNFSGKALQSIEEIQNKMWFFNTTAYPSGVINGFHSTYNRLFATVLPILETMQIDWHTAQACMAYKQAFEEYLAQRMNPKKGTVTMRELEMRCDSIWKESDITTTSIESPFELYHVPPVTLETHINSDDIDDLKWISERMDDIYGAILDYHSHIMMFNTEKYAFSGPCADAIKNYFSEMHVRMLSGINNIVIEFRDYIDCYRLSYEMKMPEDKYHYELEDLKRLMNSLKSIRDSVMAECNDFNGYVATHNRIEPDICLHAMSFSGYDLMRDKIIGECTSLGKIINDINDNESQGYSFIRDLNTDIDYLHAAHNSMKRSNGYRVVNYRAGDYLNSISRKDIKDLDNIIRGKSLYRDENEFYLYNISENKDFARAKDALIKSMESNLIDSLGDVRDDTYDEAVLRDKIRHVNFNNLYLMSGWLSLYRDLRMRGFSDSDAMKYSEIALLYNSKAVEYVNSTKAEEVVINGIKNYVKNYALHIANDSSHGYCQGQENRWGVDMDCSSLVVTAYEKAGVPMRQLTGCDNMLTYDMTRDNMEKCGFKAYKPNDNQEDGCANLQLEDLRTGDILVTVESHTEVYIGNEETVSAHGSEDVFRWGDSDTKFGNKGDQLQDMGLDALRNTSETDHSDWYYRTALQGTEENYVSDPSGSKDSRGNDRVGEIRVENISTTLEDGSKEIGQNIGYKGYDVSSRADWDYIYRLENLDFLRH